MYNQKLSNAIATGLVFGLVTNMVLKQSGKQITITIGWPKNH